METSSIRTQVNILQQKEKKPVWATLSWDSERRHKVSWPSSSAGRMRIHSDGEDGDEEEGEEGEGEGLEYFCSHCALTHEYRKSLLKTEIESAVTRLARRLGAREKKERNVDSKNVPTPDIVVSSISSDEDEDRRGTVSDSSCSSSVSPSPHAFPDVSRQETSPSLAGPTLGNISLESSPDPVFPLQLLSVNPDNPPRSNSVDLSTLQRELELFSISSCDDSSPPTPESIRTIRSRSHDPAAESQLRRPSRIEHLTVLFRRALARPPRRKQSEYNAPPEKHRTARYWTDDSVDPSEHLWIPLGGTSSSDDCYLGDRGKCERSGEKLRCTTCHVVAHVLCVPHITKMNVNCKTTFREPQKKNKESMEGSDGHHWVHRWKYEGRCSACGKTFHQKIFFSQKEKVSTKLRLLVCGGDGTVGWVLATLDSLNWPTYPPMALIPLGTGNDLSRCLGWGGSFTDEPLAQLLNAILHESSVTHLDRWRLVVTANVSCPLEEEDDEVHSALPLTVMNNYFSVGADAHVALQFHHSRSANPSMLNSRLKNRIAYGGLGTIDLFKRSWKDLSEFVQLECDGVDLTWRVKELKLHCILFHNISYYAGGTVPWGVETDESQKPSCCDGKIEVLGFTTATLAALQMGGRGERLAQCRKAEIRTTKAIPMQVDGEPCLLAPSHVTLSFHSKVPMLRREKKSVCAPSLIRRGRRRTESCQPSTSLILQLPVLVVGRHDYDTYKDALERLKDTAFEVGVINVEAEMVLKKARVLIQKVLSEHPCLPYEHTADWRFLDYVSNADEGTFRVSRHQENVLSVSDASNTDECMLILDDAFPSMTSRAAAITASDLEFSPSSTQWSSTERRFSETLRIVLSSHGQETHL